MRVVRNRLVRAVAVVGAAALFAGAGDLLAGAASAADISIIGPWARATVRGASVAAGYLTIANKGKQADRLTGASSDVSTKVDIHETRMTGGIMRMREMPNGIEIAAGKSVVFKPGGYHLMLIGLSKQLLPHTTIHLKLDFAKAGEIDVAMPVEPFGAMGPPPAKK